MRFFSRPRKPVTAARTVLRLESMEDRSLLSAPVAQPLGGTPGAALVGSTRPVNSVAPLPAAPIPSFALPPAAEIPPVRFAPLDSPSFAAAPTTPRGRGAATEVRGATFFTGTGLSGEFVNRLRDEGANSLRWQLLPFGDALKRNDEAYFQSLRTYDGYMTWVREQIAELKNQLPRLHQAGVRVIINVHVAPMMDPRDWGRPGQQAAMNNLFAKGPVGDAARRAFYDAWKAISDAFKTDGRVAGYDLLNEPRMPAGGNLAIDYNGLMAEAAKRIRRNGDDKRLVVESLRGDPTLLSRLATIKDASGRNDPNVEYSFHLYYTTPDGRVNHDPSGVARVLRGVREWQGEQSRRGRVNIYIGELGTGITDERRADFDDKKLAAPRQFLKQVLNFARDNGWDWAYFEFHSDVRFPTTSELTFIREAYRGRAIK